MADRKDQQPAGQDDRQQERRTQAAQEERDQRANEQMADAQETLFYAQVSARTGWGEAEAKANLKRLREQGDFFDDEGRWTLDAAGWPVCLKGWKEEKIADL